MSRLAKKPIMIPSGIAVAQSGHTISVKGSKGVVARDFRDEIGIAIGDKEIVLTPRGESKFVQSLLGTYASHLSNMIHGVHTPYEKKLIIEGIGFKAEVSGKNIILSIGFSHKVTVPIPDGITATVEKNVITISGIDKELVGLFAARVRAKKKPEPYKGKGIRYEKEIIRRKQGKKTA